jgi:hypothetical protein
LALVEGDTENATVVKRLLSDLRERGLEVTKPILFVLDGSKALPPAIRAVFDHPVIARCEEHKVRNVRRHLPKDVARIVERRMRAAYRNADPLRAQGDLEALASELDRSHPGAAASLREGLIETFTISRLGVPPTLARTLRSTNCIESMIDICKDHARNVKRWRDGTMALRWCAAGMLEAKKQFRRVNGHLHLRALRAALDAQVAAVAPSTYDAPRGGGRVARTAGTVIEIPRRSGHPRAQADWASEMSRSRRSIRRRCRAASSPHPRASASATSASVSTRWVSSVGRKVASERKFGQCSQMFV